jgi:hypothetical protein
MEREETSKLHKELGEWGFLRGKEPILQRKSLLGGK